MLSVIAYVQIVRQLFYLYVFFYYSSCPMYDVCYASDTVLIFLFHYIYPPLANVNLLAVLGFQIDIRFCKILYFLWALNIVIILCSFRAFSISSVVPLAYSRLALALFSYSYFSVLTLVRLSPCFILSEYSPYSSADFQYLFTFLEVVGWGLLVV